MVTLCGRSVLGRHSRLSAGYLLDSSG